jgi:hypothetical protein
MAATSILQLLPFNCRLRITSLLHVAKGKVAALGEGSLRQDESMLFGNVRGSQRDRFPFVRPMAIPA